MSLYEKCVKIYEKYGQNGVLKHCAKIGWKQYGHCEPCEYLSPVENGTCLVCGSPVEKLNPVVTLQSAFAEIVNHLQDCGYTDDESELYDEELGGMVAMMDALINCDTGSFDGMPVYENTLVGIVLNKGK